MNGAIPAIAQAPEPRGYIQPGVLRELWFHTGTACNLACPFCLEGSRPGDDRLQRITLDDAQPLLDEAASLGVGQFSFTGGEPFVVREIIRILRYASNLGPCLVLTNGTDPMIRRLAGIETLAARPFPVSFRISIDYADPARHDASRGRGNFARDPGKALRRCMRADSRFPWPGSPMPAKTARQWTLPFAHCLRSTVFRRIRASFLFPISCRPGRSAPCRGSRKAV